MNALTLNIFSNAWLWIEDHWRAWLGVIFWLAAIFFLCRGLIALVCRGVKFVIERRRAKATERWEGELLRIARAATIQPGKPETDE